MTDPTNNSAEQPDASGSTVFAESTDAEEHTGQPELGPETDPGQAPESTSSPAGDSPDPETVAPRSAGRGAADQMLGANPVVGLDWAELFDAAQRVGKMVALDPRAVVRAQLKLVAELGRVTLGRSEIRPDPKDRRFKHEIWTENPVYKRVMQSYLAWRESMGALLEGADASDADKERARFVLALLTEAVAPTNTLFGNPGAVHNAFKTRGGSVLKGLGNMLDDLMNNGGMPRQVDESLFRVGGNLALTPGAVVYRDEVFELIQYAPATKEVFSRPMLVVPPQINKYYVLDIAPGRSFAEYATHHGVQLFTISWRNPTGAQRDWDLETYLAACLRAIDVICEVTGSKDTNLIAACAGGFTSATLLGHMAAKGDTRVNSATFLVTVLDTRAPTLMGQFASRSGVEAAKARSAKHGVLDGRDMARVFAWLRPNDLVWSFFANNWVMGNDPPAFDVLYWNADSTRLTAGFHSDMLDVYWSNPLVEAGKLEVLGTPIDMSAVSCDTYVIAGITDHITPWKACFQSRKVLENTDMTFVLSSSGHIQALVNPPDNPKARYFVDGESGADSDADADAWLESADERQGSWWHHWYEWQALRGGERIPAPKTLGIDKHPAGDQAPGRYVHQR
jgi:poly[(R)-3-hydroxyalkanoate] polymerase subunit PhaC